MKYSAAALLSAGLWPGMLAAQDSAAADLSFIQINDLHFWDQGCAPFFERAVAAMKRAAPNARLMLVVGDQVEHGKPEEFAGISAILKTAGMQIRTVPGNHDWTAQTDRKAYEQACPDSINYTFQHGGWQFVGLDSTDGTKSSVSILKPTFDWLDENLPKLEQKRPTILFTHFPLGAGVKNRAANADDLLDRFKPFNLRAVFGGHYHASTSRTVGDYTLTTDKCCSFRAGNHDGTKEKGFFACAVKEGKITRTFVEVSMT